MLNQKQILVPHSMGQEGLALLRARGDIHLVLYDPAIRPTEFHPLLEQTAAIALSWTRFGVPEVAAAPQLQAVTRLGVGFDAVDVPALTARRIPLLTAGTANSRAVAEHALHFMLALVKKAAEMDRRLRQGLGHDRRTALPEELGGKTVLLVGFGRIGSRVAPRCRAMEMDVLVYDPLLPSDTIRRAGYEPVPDLDAGLPRADFLTLHCPRNPDTIGLIGPARLARMKPGAFLVNTARGGIVDEPALTQALLSGHLSGAALDVFDPEPPDPANPLLQMETVIASPHMAGVTAEAWAAICCVAAENILAVLDGRPRPEYAVNPEVFVGPATVPAINA